MSKNLEYRERQRQRKRESRRQASKAHREKGQQRSRARDKKQSRHFFAGKTTWKFFSGGEKMTNATQASRVERLKDPQQRMQRSFLMTQKDPSKGFHKDMTRHISLKQFWKIHPKHHVTFLGPWSHKTSFLKRDKVVKIKPKNTCHQIVSETVWIVN